MLPALEVKVLIDLEMALLVGVHHQSACSSSIRMFSSLCCSTVSLLRPAVLHLRSPHQVKRECYCDQRAWRIHTAAHCGLIVADACTRRSSNIGWWCGTHTRT